MIPYEKELLKLIGGQVQHVGISRDGYPYLIVAKPQSDEVFYVIAQCDAEGNGPGFLQLTQRQTSEAQQ